jgi:hypothetical protein
MHHASRQAAETSLQSVLPNSILAKELAWAYTDRLEELLGCGNQPPDPEVDSNDCVKLRVSSVGVEANSLSRLLTVWPKK